MSRRLLDLFVAWLTAVAVLTGAGAGVGTWAALESVDPGWRIVGGVLAGLGAATPVFAIIAVVTLLASIDDRLSSDS